MALPNAKILIHQVSSASRARRRTSRSTPRRSSTCASRLDEILADHTGQDLEKVSRDTERDYFMSAEEATAYHLIDRVIEPVGTVSSDSSNNS